MNDDVLDQQIRAAFVARSEGSPSRDLADRIRTAAATTRQEHPLIALPRSGRFIAVRHLALAAALGGAVLVAAGALLSGAGVAPPDVPNVPIVPPSTPPTVQPTLQPDATPETVYLPDSVVRIGTPGVVTVHAEADADSSALAEIPSGTSLFIVDRPTTIDGVAWYLVQPFDIAVKSYPMGWVAATDAGGTAVLEPTVLECPSGVMPWTAVHGLTMTGALACFGSDPIEVTGHIFCMGNDDLPEDLQHRVTGPVWLDDGRYCAFQDQSGEPAFEIIGFPTDELPPTWQTSELRLRGHFDDPESAECISVEGNGPVSAAEAVLTCRSMFHAGGYPVVID